MAKRGGGRCFGQDLMRGEHSVGAERERELGDGNKLKFSAAATISRANGSIGGDGSKILRGEAGEESVTPSGTSIFDPVLTELVYRWFCPPGGSVLDPFAGESVKGIVAAVLGYHYCGVELRPGQIAANEQQWSEIAAAGPAAGDGMPAPKWICGDSARLPDLLPRAAEYDLLFTSPPYYDLEVYSDSDQDGSAKQTYAEFLGWYRGILAAAAARLRPGRFAVLKVGEIRDEAGIYRNFVGDTIAAMKDAGLHYYNEIILIQPAGSLPIRVGKQFSHYRKIGKCHQNILVFLKGEPAAIPAAFPADVPAVDLTGEDDTGPVDR